jgi:UDP-2,3-diacylglucosamine pyrophosphatase LpxH
MAIPPLTYRTVFVSDVHLGSAACRIEEFQEFLHAFNCETLYLVGDIIDVWVIVKSGKWNQNHTNAVRTILGKTKHGCQVRLIPGNHDAFLRKTNSLELGNVALEDSFIHETANGKKLLVIHGDQFDSTVKSFALAFAGTWFYELLTIIRLARQRRKGAPPTQKRGGIKNKFKKLVSALGNWEAKLVLAAQTEGCDGVICGHIHRPALTDQDGTLYGNCGDWVESKTAIVEHFDGTLELLSWDQMKQMADAAPKLELRLPPDGSSEVR